MKLFTKSNIYMFRKVKFFSEYLLEDERVQKIFTGPKKSEANFYKKYLLFMDEIQRNFQFLVIRDSSFFKTAGTAYHVLQLPTHLPTYPPTHLPLSVCLYVGYTTVFVCLLFPMPERQSVRFVNSPIFNCLIHCPIYSCMPAFTWMFPYLFFFW